MRTGWATPRGPSNTPCQDACKVEGKRIQKRLGVCAKLCVWDQLPSSHDSPPKGMQEVRVCESTSQNLTPSTEEHTWSVDMDVPDVFSKALRPEENTNLFFNLLFLMASCF